MRTSKFFRLTISGDDLNPVLLKEAIGLPCDIYLKGVLTKITRKRDIIQKTNRWIYEDIAHDETEVDTFLTKNLEMITKNLVILKPYIVCYKTTLEYIVYADNNTDIKLTKKQIELLYTIGVELQISFC